MRIILASLFLLLPLALRADPPRVVVDIAPLHSLVSMVMQDVAAPELLLPTNASPHSYSLRPSDARRLSEADIVFWIGAPLIPWLQDSLEALAPNSQRISVLNIEGWEALALRDDPNFAEDHEHSDHDAIDPHAWLDPQAAKIWLGAIAEILAKADPDNATLYRQNAQQAARLMDQLTDEISAQFSPMTESKYLVPHDAYHYFEARFGLEPVGAISLSDTTGAGPSHIQNLQNLDGISCVLSDPQTSLSLSELVENGRDIRTAKIDAMGSDIELGPELYPEMMRQLATQISGCLAN